MLKKLWKFIVHKFWKSDPWIEIKPSRIKPLSAPEVTSFTGAEAVTLPPIPVIKGIIQYADQKTHPGRIYSKPLSGNPVVLLTDTAPSPVEIVKVQRKRKSPAKKIKAKTLEKRPKSP